MLKRVRRCSANSLSPGPPFGMDGHSTLLWNTIVRLKCPHLVTQAGFVMAERIFKQSIPDSPLISEFAVRLS